MDAINRVHDRDIGVVSRQISTAAPRGYASDPMVGPLAFVLQSAAGMRGVLITALLVGCSDGGDPASTDITGPFTGEARRYVVDDFDVVRNTNDSPAVEADLDGDDVADNALGRALSLLAFGNNITAHGPDMIASGVIASSVIIRADDLIEDPAVSVMFLGADDAGGTAVGGRFRQGRFLSNRTATTMVPGEATVRLPVFVDSDPSVLPLKYLEMELLPDDAGGFTTYVRGYVPVESVLDATYLGVTQLLAANPGGHRFVRGTFDKDPVDWTVTRHEVATNDLIESLFAPEVTRSDEPLLSFAFAVHLVPCESGRCSTAPPADTCHDRVLDGDETDVDCGGSCRACRTDETCGSLDDCDSRACDAGVCTAPRCDDGVRDGYETDVDCGGPCTACEIGGRCWDNNDCGSAQCGPPCTDPDPLDCINTDPSHDICYAP